MREENTCAQKKIPEAAHIRREAADAASLEIVQRVINAVRSDPEEGEDSELYSAMGYIRESVLGRNRRRGNGRDDAQRKDVVIRLPVCTTYR